MAEQGVEEPKTEEVAPEVDMPPYNIRINLPNDAEVSGFSAVAIESLEAYWMQFFRCALILTVHCAG